MFKAVVMEFDEQPVLYRGLAQFGQRACFGSMRPWVRVPHPRPIKLYSGEVPVCRACVANVFQPLYMPTQLNWSSSRFIPGRMVVRAHPQAPMFVDGCFIESMASLFYSWSQTSPVFVYERNASRGYGRKRECLLELRQRTVNAERSGKPKDPILVANGIV